MNRRTNLRSIWSGLACLLFVAVAMLPAGRPVFAQEPSGDAGPLPQLSITDSPQGGVIQWTTSGATTSDAVNQVLPAREFQGYTLPMKAIAFRVTGGPDAGALQIRQVQAVDLPPDSVIPNPIDSEPLVIDETTVLPAPVETPQLPSAPAFVLYSGMLNGEWIVVVGFSPVYSENGSLRLATGLDAIVTGAVRAPDAAEVAAQMSASEAAAADSGDFADIAATSAPEPYVDPALASQTDALDVPDAASAPVKLMVSAPGIQRVPRSGLGASYSTVDLKSVRLTFKGLPVPVQSSANEIRFYASAVGDRWNSVDAYILTIESDPARRSPQIAVRPVTVPVASADAAEIEATSTALDRGVWLQNKFYDSMYPGNDADHYFAAKLVRVQPSDPAQQFVADLTAVALIRPANQLPLYKGLQKYSLNLVKVEAESFGGLVPLNVTVAGGSSGSASKSLDVDFSNSPVQKIPVSFNPTDARGLTLTLRNGTNARALLVDSIAYERPVLLNLGGHGAVFAGAATQKTYRWTGASTVLGAIGLWDVTNPAQPIAMSGPTASGFVDSFAARSYIVAGDGFVQTPAVISYHPIAASSLPAAHAIYVIPNGSYASALQPLVNLRQTQVCRSGVKCLVGVVDVTRIYDGYGYGMVSPEAIRLFLRDFYVKHTSPSPRLMSVVLVGDGSWDPKNFEGKQTNPTLIPPYMHEGVDRSFGEAPCDRCYAQYTGYSGLCVDPHTCDDQFGKATAFSPEAWQGRFPVKSVFELQQLVAKIYGYETATDSKAPWRSRVLYIADNYMKGDGPKPVPDTAGDFAANLDVIRNLNPSRNSAYSAPRVYYDPFPGAQKPPKYGQPWRVSDPQQAWSRSIASFNDGVSVAVYYGHATPYTMARYDLPTAWRFAMIENIDTEYLTNAKRLFMALSMTCLTSQFARPSDTGSTLDEAFLMRPNGGSVAVWGPAGYGIVHGHDQLLTGFFTKLFAAKGAPQSIGSLADAGYAELAKNALGHYDMLRTFGIMGDPLTRIRVGPALYPIYLPVTKR